MDQEFNSSRINHPIDVDRARARVMAHVRSDVLGRRTQLLVRYAGLAASLLIVSAAAYVLSGNRSWSSIATSTKAPNSKTFSTGIGQRANVKLADGSVVIIAPATTLRVLGRSIDLSGEAIFTVTQRTGEPFIVRANNTVTRVLGTH